MIYCNVRWVHSDILTSHLKRCNFNVIIMIYWPEGKCLWAKDAPGEPCWWYWLEILSAVICRAFCDIAEIQQYFQPPSRIFIMPEMLQMKYHSVDDITVFNSVQSWGDVYKTQVSFNIHFIVYNLALIAELRVVEFSSPWEMLITELSIWFQLQSVLLKDMFEVSSTLREQPLLRTDDLGSL